MCRRNIVFLFIFISVNLLGQKDTLDDKYIESELVSLAGKNGVSLKSANESFLFKPYVLIQTKANYNYYDDEGLNLAEQDNVLNSGFGIPYALVGFAGKAFDKISFNLALNSAGSGAAILNQAWFDINFKDEVRLRVGKFKTPFSQAYLVHLGQTLFLQAPSSLTTRTNLPFDINSVNPQIATGFDIGLQLHGLIKEQFEYRIGIFNGTGISYNNPTNTLSDDLGIPSLLYSARIAYMPFGKMPLHQGDPFNLSGKYISLASSISYNVEANFESSNDLRAGFEVALILNKFYFSSEAYMLNMSFVERQQIQPKYTFWGAYAQGAYFITDKLQTALRFDVLDRNSTEENGLLFMPAFGVNYFPVGHNLKVQSMYQYLGKSGHDNEFEANDDDNGMPEHMICVQLQFSF